MISSTFSERISTPSKRMSATSFEAIFTNATDNHVTQAVGNHSPFILVWIVDSGASCHICKDPTLFENLEPCYVKILTAKSEESISATGFGDVCLNTWNEQGHPELDQKPLYFMKRILLVRLGETF
jgi:hypothetical protein